MNELSNPRSPEAYGRVAVMLGGVSGERAVSLESGNNVLTALLDAGVDAFAFDPQNSRLGELIRAKPDRVFMMLHGQPGEDGRYQAVLDLHGIPYTGSGMFGSALALDKRFSKELWLNRALPTPAFMPLDESVGETEADWQHVRAKLQCPEGSPLVIKPSCEGSSLGISIVHSAEQWRSGLDDARQYRGEVLAERFVQGNEYTVAVVGGQALPTVAIRYATAFYDYAAKYTDDRTELVCPAGLPQSVDDELQRLAVAAAAPLKVRGWYRVDFIVDQQLKPHILEINTAPGMTSHSLVPKAAKVFGWSYRELVLRILAMASFDPIH